MSTGEGVGREERVGVGKAERLYGGHWLGEDGRNDGGGRGWKREGIMVVVEGGRGKE